MQQRSPHHSPLSYALAYIKRGWRVFPLYTLTNGDCSCGRDSCSSPGKHPRKKNGVKDATTDSEQVRLWWNWWPEANIGIATGNGLMVIDADLLKGANLDDLHRFDLASLSDTLTALSGSGGPHYYLTSDVPLPNTAGALAPFIDTRGEGGYIVAPPSRNKYGQYRWLTPSAPLAPVTPELLAFLMEHAGTTSDYKTSLTTGHEGANNDIYQTHSQASSLKEQTILSSGTPDQNAARTAGVAREARNDFLIKTVGGLRARGLSVDEMSRALFVINEDRYGNGKHPQGPLSREEIENTVLKSARKYEIAGGVLAGGPEIEQLRTLMSTEIPDPVWIVPQLVSEGLTLLVGKPKLGKSWLALALALTCALGTEHGGGQVLGRYAVEPAEVLYLSLEDSPARFQKRVRKLLAGREVPEHFVYTLQWKPLKAGGLLDLDARLTASPNTRLVVVDTLARVRTPGAGGGNMY